MPEEQVALDRWSLTGLQRELNTAEEAELDDVTLVVEFSSPKGFVHEWTLQDVSSAEQLSEEIDNTLDAAKNRLQNGWLEATQETVEIEEDGEVREVEREKAESDFNRVWQEIQETMTVSFETPEQAEEEQEFRKKKGSIPDLKQAIEDTEEVYSRVDRSRSQRIQSSLNQETENLEEYKENVKKVDENIDFEERTDIKEGDKGVFSGNRQATTGELDWYNKEGERIFTLVFPSQVIFQRGERGGEEVARFEDKDQALEYYKNNRLA